MQLFLLFLVSSFASGILLRNKPVWWRYLFLIGIASLLCYAYLYTNDI